MKLVGAVVMRVILEADPVKEGPQVLLRFKIFSKGSCDWHGLILGGRALDVQENGGLGLRVTRDKYVLEGPGAVLPRVEEDVAPRYDSAYGFRVGMLRASVVDSDDECDEDGEGMGLPMGSLRAAAPGIEGDPLTYEGPAMALAPDEGAWVPVRRGGKNLSDSRDCEVVFQAEGAPVDIATGLWPTGVSEGLVFVANTTEFDQHIDSGARLGAVARAAVQTRLCMACGAEDTEAWATQAGAEGCALCGAAQPAGKSSCRQCGAGPDQVEVLRYAGCTVCTGTRVRRARQGAVAASMRPAPCAAPGEVSRSLWKLVGTLGVLCGSMQAVNTMTNPVYHIVEEPGAIERMAEVEVPTEHY